MSLAIDAIIIFAAIIIIWSGTCKGFVRSIMGLISSVASLFAAYAYSPMLATYIKENYIIKNITAGINETLKSLAFDTNTDFYNLDRLAAELPEQFTDILERYGINIEAFSKKLVGLTACGEDKIYDFSKEIAEPTSNVISSVLSFIVVFVAAFLVLSLITALLDLIFKLPVLKTANMVLGFVFGAVEAVVFVSVLAILLSTLVTALGSINSELFGESAMDKTMICKYIVEHNIFSGFLR